MPITPFPGPVPSTSDPANFNARADATLGHLPVFVSDANALQVDVNAVAAIVSQDSIAAQNAAIAAAQSVSDAAAASGATKWASGSYAQGAVVWSPISGLNYRRKTAGSGATDPSSDSANWWLMSAPAVLPIVSISTNTAAVPGLHYLITASLTLTLPAGPQVGAAVQFTDMSGSRTCIINPNGRLIRGVSGNMILNSAGAAALLVDSGAAKGWI